MVVEHQPGGTRLLDVLDRILDKGIVIDAWIRFQLAGIDLITIDARVVVASIETYLNYAESLRQTCGGRVLNEGGAARDEGAGKGRKSLSRRASKAS